MTKSKLHIEHLISPYLDGELNEKERQEFESHLQGCDQCSRLLREHQEAGGFIDSYLDAQSKHPETEILFAYHDGSISRWQHRLVEHHLNSCGPCRKILKAAEALRHVEPELSERNHTAASAKRIIHTLLSGFLEKKRLIPAIAVVAAATLLLVLFLPKSNPYASMVEITPAPYVSAEIRGDEDEARIIFESGMEQYLDKDYAAAEHFLEEAVRTESDNPQFQFFYGVTLLLNQDYRKGLDQLTKTALRQSSYRQDALWYAAQAQLKLGKSETAVKDLQELTRSDGEFYDRARALLKEIRTIQD